MSDSAFACFPEGAPSREIFEGWRLLMGLPKGAQQNLWQLLWLAIRTPDDPEARDALQAFSQRFEANAANLLGAVRTCDFLLRQAASLGVSAEAFRGDLVRLAHADPDGGTVEMLMSGFDEANAFLRSALLEATLADHGNVLTGFDWRVDQVRLSNHGRLSATDVVFLNLKYRAQKDERQLSLQLTPHAIAALRTLFDELYK
jgi:hypothetical protein